MIVCENYYHHASLHVASFPGPHVKHGSGVTLGKIPVCTELSSLGKIPVYAELSSLDFR